VILGWILGKPLTLLFDPYESIAMFLSGTCQIIKAVNHFTDFLLFSVLTVSYVIQDGKSNWLEGFILMCTFYPLSLAVM
jgi:Ca2+:H+ antiporter